MNDKITIDRATVEQAFGPYTSHQFDEPTPAQERAYRQQQRNQLPDAPF